MQTPADLPRRRAGGIGTRGRAGLIVLAVAFFLLLTSLRGIAGFWTDYLWFDSLGLSGVFTGVLGARIVLGALFTGIFFLILWLNLLIADRVAPRFRPAGPEEEVIERYYEIVGQRTGLVRAGVALLFALIVGVGVSGQWNTWILFTNARDFGVTDPQFGMDIGFYVFRLPFLTFLVDWAFASLVIIAIVVAAAHYLNGGIRVQGAAQRVTPQVKAHLSVLLGMLALVRAAGYFLARYELNFSTRGTVQGATYTDVNAQLPALFLLILISLAAFILFIVNIWRRGWVLPALAVGLWAFVALIVGGLYPAFVQRFQVEPSESSRERPFIERNIEATRVAMGLDNVRTRDFAADNQLDAADLIENEATVRNIRLWDPQVLIRSFKQLQEIRPYYNISDVNVDRYDIDGEITQVLVSARELDTAGVPQNSWEARQLAFTHGYGATLAPANAKTPTGRPNIIVGDVPVSDEAGIGLEQPGIYIGENLGGYVITQTDRAEIDFQTAEGETVLTEYEGADGVGIGSYTRRAAFALRFGDINPLISGNLRADSRILYIRDVRERVQAAAPFIQFDADPYPVLSGGEVRYVIDGYTTSNHYPYAQRADTTQVRRESGLNRDFNYVRNSVKAVVDAYEGTVNIYIIDPDDPVVAAYAAAFPELFSDIDDLPEGLDRHFRYPEDLFTVQTNMWGEYHVEDPDVFYNGNDAWDVAADPGTAGSAAATQEVDAQGRPIGPARDARIEPTYILTRLPGEDKEDFIILRPFVPTSGDDQQRLLTSFMVAKGDPGNYGELESFVMPRSALPDGPGIVAASIGADQEVSELETLLGTSGSRVLFGNLVVYPIEQSLLYVRPMYVEPVATQIPELRKVIVFFNGRVEVEDTLEQALINLFGDAPETQEEGPTIGSDSPDPVDPDAEVPALPATVAEMLAQAEAEFAEGQAALERGDLGAYQEHNDEGRRLLSEAIRAAREEESPTTTTTQEEAATA
ncbi:MAG TPA: UPF0182 family protein [Acidimicrobiales bacterium]|nr:UPF0182 family protein [Acidimicrobiales bacterium]